MESQEIKKIQSLKYDMKQRSIKCIMQLLINLKVNISKEIILGTPALHLTKGQSNNTENQ